LGESKTGSRQVQPARQAKLHGIPTPPLPYCRPVLLRDPIMRDASVVDNNGPSGEVWRLGREPVECGAWSVEVLEAKFPADSRRQRSTCFLGACKKQFNAWSGEMKYHFKAWGPMREWQSFSNTFQYCRHRVIFSKSCQQYFSVEAKYVFFKVSWGTAWVRTDIPVIRSKARFVTSTIVQVSSSFVQSRVIAIAQARRIASASSSFNAYVLHLREGKANFYTANPCRRGNDSSS
jgi:hypothetical protein